MTRLTWILVGALASGALVARSAGAAEARRPNLVIILADDLGYGDLGCYNSQSKIATPKIDEFAREGLRFTDAHSPSSVCTPTRYGLLTGRYAWRTRLKQGVLGGYSPPLIEEGRATLASLLKLQGYHTACMGKWHVGWEWPTRDGAPFGDEIQGTAGPAESQLWSVAWKEPIRRGPCSIGFDDFFGISASLDMPPYVFLEQDRVVQTPTTEKKWIRQGPAAADFEAQDVLPQLTKRAVSWLEEQATHTDRPFFLYLALTSPHTPLVPTNEFAGKSHINDYADFVMQTDAAIGQVLEALTEQHLRETTLVVITSDNGCSPAADLATLKRHGHAPSGPWRGYKADLWEGGHRVPFLARWPGHVPAGAISSETICHTDLLATCVAAAGATLPRDAGEDSYNFMEVLTGSPSSRPVREATVHHSIDGSFAIRRGPWKLLLCPGSGGWSEPRPGREPVDARKVQLYHLENDPGETTNLAGDEPQVVAELKTLLEHYRTAGRSTSESK